MNKLWNTGFSNMWLQHYYIIWIQNEMNKIREVLFYKSLKAHVKTKRNSDLVNTIIGIQPVVHYSGEGKKGNY